MKKPKKPVVYRKDYVTIETADKIKLEYRIANPLLRLLDFLVIDMPPGISDAVLDLIRLVKRIEFLIVTTPSLLAFETVKKQVRLLQDLKVPIIGVVENMKTSNAENVKQGTKKLGVKFLTGIPYDPEVEDAIGDVTLLLNTKLAQKISEVAANNITK